MTYSEICILNGPNWDYNTLWSLKYNWHCSKCVEASVLYTLCHNCAESYFHHYDFSAHDMYTLDSV